MMTLRSQIGIASMAIITAVSVTYIFRAETNGGNDLSGGGGIGATKPEHLSLPQLATSHPRPILGHLDIEEANGATINNPVDVNGVITAIADEYRLPNASNSSAYLLYKVLEITEQGESAVVHIRAEKSSLFVGDLVEVVGVFDKLDSCGVNHRDSSCELLHINSDHPIPDLVATPNGSIQKIVRMK